MVGLEWGSGGGRGGGVNLEALGDETQERRRSVCCRRACAVCARLDGDDTREYVRLWQQLAESPAQSCIGDSAIMNFKKAVAWGLCSS